MSEIPRAPAWAAIALAAACASGAAQADDATAALERKLDASMRVIEALQKRVEQLEKAQGLSPAAAAAPAPALDARLEAVEHSLAQAEASNAAAAQVDTGMPIHGFADIRGGAHNAAREGDTPRGVKVGVFDLYMTPQISPQIKTLVELAFEYEDGGELGVDAERMQLGYAFSDALTVWTGRFHTPYGYWNTAFHHGAQLQTSIARPRFLDFEDDGGILPAHSVGVWATGAARSSIGKVGYDLYVANGDRIRAGTLDFQPLGDGDHNFATGFRLDLAPNGRQWHIGVHGLAQDVRGDQAAGVAGARVRMRMFGGFATYDSDDWEGMAEYYAFRNTDVGTGTGLHVSNAWYAQLGYNLNDRFTPYARWEQASLDASDPYFATQEGGDSYHRLVAGVRYNLTPKAALKAEVRQTRGPSIDGSADSASVQYSIRF